MLARNFVLRIIVVCALVIALLQLIQGWSLVHRERDRSSISLAERIDVTVRDLQVSLKDPLWDLDVEHAKSLVEDRMRQSFFVGAEVLDSEKKPLFALARQSDQVQNVKGLSAASIVKEYKFEKEGKPFAFARFHFSDAMEKTNLRKTIQILVISSIIMGLAIVLLLWWVLRILIEQPVQSTSDALKNIAAGDGDLTSRLNQERQDQIGRLARWFNQFIGKIQNSMRTISQGSSTLSSASEQLSCTATEMTKRSLNMATELAAAASLTVEASINLQNISDTSQEISMSLQAVAAAVEQMNATIEHVAHNSHTDASIAEEANSKAESAKIAMEELNQSANEIGKLVDIIQNIASKTNLLALNATIEAASAGEAGRGFAVVAGEVKELARQTAKASQQVRTQIESVRRDSANSRAILLGVSDSVMRIKSNTNNLANALEQQTSAMSEISKSFGVVALNSKNVSDRVAKTSVALGTSSKSISHVSGLAAEMEVSVEEVQLGAADLAKLAAGLQVVVGQFRV